MTARTLVIGLGNPDRGDDAVGLVVARQVAELVARPGYEAPDVRVVELDDPSDALEAWLGAGNVVIADAVASGASAGEVLVVDLRAHPLPVGTWASGGTHALGLAAVVELARALGRLPRRLVMVGVEAEGFGHGTPLSDAVESAVPAAVTAVLAAIDPMTTINDLGGSR